MATYSTCIMCILPCTSVEYFADQLASPGQLTGLQEQLSLATLLTRDY